MIAAAGVRAVVGAACLLAPGSVLTAIGAPDHQEARTRAVTRVLGARYLLHAGVGVLAPGPRTARAGAAIEVAHAATMLPLARRGRHRRAALASAGVAGTLALLDLREAAARPPLAGFVPR